jgi:hypothetical protein
MNINYLVNIQNLNVQEQIQNLRKYIRKIPSISFLQVNPETEGDLSSACSNPTSVVLVIGLGIIHVIGKGA